jgi:hypothetical protein
MSNVSTSPGLKNATSEDSLLVLTWPLTILQAKQTENC